MFAPVPAALAPHLVDPRALARHTLPVEDALVPLFPDGGLVRGTAVALEAEAATGGATSLALSVAAGSSRAGSWVAVVGVADLGLAALTGCGIDVGRVLVVPRVPPRAWARVLAVLIGAVDVVVLGPPDGGSPGRAVPPRVGRRLGTTVREHGAVLLTVGWEIPGFDAAVRLRVASTHWGGVGEGHGHLSGRRVEVVRGGRAAAARPLRCALWLPDTEGSVRAATGDATVLSWPGASR